MTQSQALAKLEQLVKEKAVSRNSQSYKTALAAIESPDTPQPCGKNTGSGRYSSSTSWLTQTTFLLMRIGLQSGSGYTVGNSAPKGGKHGDEISVHFYR